ncbi:cytochrome c oxidase subunit II [Ardenticatena maritima]|uniref:Cytochrome aa3 subunit 2 n=1 Tax=Ardenticatena maritima TaxID=872965 RepID=A0A0M8KAV4_9CHLR|nr:cytochrome c oxidase subunit II [Ardenticatena maritima]KPL89631.1 cytochrome C oxidase subunit II [Ardenticatena maritima]GAP63856.1 cytochrome c oxidase subunit II [Ardenticatena maritima]
MPIERSERLFINLSILMLVIFFIAVLVSAFIGGLQVPAPAGTIDPAAINQTAPFDNPGVRELVPGKRYEVVMIAQTWAFIPGEIRVPAGSEVTFRITSRDVIHGFEITGKNANVMLIPGQISLVKVKFDKPGEHYIICHEYCGIGHQTMYAKIIVEPAPQAAK